MSPQSIDWHYLTTLPRGARLTDIAPQARELDLALYEIGPGTYVMTRPRYDDDEPGIDSIIWAQCEAALWLVYSHKPGEVTTQSHPPPTTDALGFSPLTYAQAVAHEKANGNSPKRRPAKRFPDFEPIYGEIHTRDREYYFANPKPTDDEPPMAIRFDLRTTDESPRHPIEAFNGVRQPLRGLLRWRYMRRTRSDD